MQRVMKRPNGCWDWIAPVRRWQGQLRAGDFAYKGEREIAYRLMYRLFRGDFPNELYIDHLCRNGRCVNPDHLEPVTHKENTLRGTAPSAVNATKTHCVHGHSLDDAYVSRRTDGRVRRSCRTCVREGQRRRYAERKAS